MQFGPQQRPLCSSDVVRSAAAQCRAIAVLARLITAERAASSVAVQQLMSSALRRVVLITAERAASSVAVQRVPR
jgi:hypothetical protein